MELGNQVFTSKGVNVLHLEATRGGGAMADERRRGRRQGKDRRRGHGRRGHGRDAMKGGMFLCDGESEIKSNRGE